MKNSPVFGTVSCDRVMFNCPDCGASLSVAKIDAGTDGDCPACGATFNIRCRGFVGMAQDAIDREEGRGVDAMHIPAIQSLVQRQIPKSKEDLIADGICAVALAGWSATKYVAPIAAKVTLNIGMRAASSAGKAATLAVNSVGKAADRHGVTPVLEKITLTPSEKKGLVFYTLWKMFGGPG